MENTSFEWEITSKESKSRNLQSFPVVASALAGVAIVLAIRERTWIVIFVFLIIIAVFFVFSLLFAKFIPRKFKIDSTGLFISKGNKSKIYSWAEFECFHTHSLIINQNSSNFGNIERRVAVNDIINLSAELNKISGNVYYLKKVKKSFWDKIIKTFVIVYSEPENQTQVEEALSNYLTHKQLTNSTELGMIRYEFK